MNQRISESTNEWKNEQTNEGKNEWVNLYECIMIDEYTMFDNCPI